MPAVLSTASVLLCAHGGAVVAANPNSRLRVDGQPAASLGSTFAVLGCPATPPCVTAQFAGGTQRVRASGVPLLTTASAGVSLPAASPLIQVPSGGRVSAR